MCDTSSTKEQNNSLRGGAGQSRFWLLYLSPFNFANELFFLQKMGAFVIDKKQDRLNAIM